MKKTLPLTVRPSTSCADDILSIHPNDGFDLGMMTTGYRVQLYSAMPLEAFVKGQDWDHKPAQVKLLNECQKETLELNMKFWKKIGEPVKAVLVYDGDRLLIQGVTVPAADKKK